MADPWIIDPKTGKLIPNPDYNPNEKPLSASDPYTWTPDQRINLLNAAGYQWQSGQGRGALWLSPDGQPVSEEAALTRVITEGSRVPGRTPSPSGAGLPAGYVQGADGLVYRQVDGQLRLATSAELDALNAPAPGAVWHGFAPQYDSYVEPRTGDQVFTVNGQETRRVSGATWAALSPEQKQAYEVALQTQAEQAALARQQAGDVAAGQRNAASDIAAGQRNAASDIAAGQRTAMQQAGESARAAAGEAGTRERFGFTYGEKAAMDRAALAEQARQANLSSATSAFGDVTRTAPQLGQLALANAGFTRDVTRNAPDYLARAFFQQGQKSPLPQVSQADLINQLRSNIEGFNTALQGFNPQVGPYVPPPAAATFPGVAQAGFPAAPIAAPIATPKPIDTTGMITAGSIPGATGAIYAPNWTPGTTDAATGVQTAGGFAWNPSGTGGVYALGGGGMTQDNMVMTGDAKPGSDKPNEELVIDLPDDGGLLVIPKDKLIGTRKHMAAKAPAMAHGGYSAAHPGFAGAAAQVSERQDISMERARKIIGAGKARASESARKKNPRLNRVPYAAGGGLFGFSIPQLPMPGQITQEGLQALERNVRPPAINTILGGGIAQTPNFGFDLFTPQQIRSLTPETRQALGTTLATQFNETPENVDFAMEQRFGPKRARGRAGQVAGFA